MQALLETIPEDQLTGEPCPGCGAEIALVAEGRASSAQCECGAALVLV